jgi:apolipoprotein N-acyltransferase
MGHARLANRDTLFFLAGISSLILNVPGLLVSSADPVALGLSVVFLLRGALGLVQVNPARAGRGSGRELLFCLALFLFLFLYVYALNANMDYVQRFMEETGEIQLAPSTSRERGIALLRCSPLLLVGLTAASPELLAVSVSAFLTAISGPSFMRLEGIPVLAFVGLVPLLVTMRFVRPRKAVLYGVYWGVLYSLIAMYWLGTFSLVSLQLAMVIQALYYVVFMVLLVAAQRVLGPWRVLFVPLAWTAFEWVRSLGFLGFPWALFAHTQHSWVDLIQVSAATGMWGVSFLVLLINSSVAEAVGTRLLLGVADWRHTAVAAVLVALVVAGGRLAVMGDGAHQRRTVRLALVQQNSDPRRHQYSTTFGTLKRLTDQALHSDPDLIVWSETAFVPNIRRWSREDPTRYSLARLVRQFLAYQKDLGRWLITGNDDYELLEAPDGSIVRREYNAAVLFDDTGNRRQTYRKIHLVPFTEHFPFKESLPGLYDLLIRYDVTLWEPGTERTVFVHPAFRFVTPICFEDVFPRDVRESVAAGADVILNLSNDYWSLTPVEAKQHYAAAVFRAVENRRPLVRASASGVTAHVDRLGREQAAAPYYQEALLVVDVSLGPPKRTLYGRWGDWFPVAALASAVALVLWRLFRRQSGRAPH